MRKIALFTWLVLITSAVQLLGMEVKTINDISENEMSLMVQNIWEGQKEINLNNRVGGKSVIFYLAKSLLDTPSNLNIKNLNRFKAIFNYYVINGHGIDETIQIDQIITKVKANSNNYEEAINNLLDDLTARLTNLNKPQPTMPISAEEMRLIAGDFFNGKHKLHRNLFNLLKLTTKDNESFLTHVVRVYSDKTNKTTQETNMIRKLLLTLFIRDLLGDKALTGGKLTPRALFETTFKPTDSMITLMKEFDDNFITISENEMKEQVLDFFFLCSALQNDYLELAMKNMIKFQVENSKIFFTFSVVEGMNRCTTLADRHFQTLRFLFARLAYEKHTCKQFDIEIEGKIEGGNTIYSQLKTLKKSHKSGQFHGEIKTTLSRYKEKKRAAFVTTHPKATNVINTSFGFMGFDSVLAKPNSKSKLSTGSSTK